MTEEQTIPEEDLSHHESDEESEEPLDYGLIDWVKGKVALPGVTLDSVWPSDTADKAVHYAVKNVSNGKPSRLFMFMDKTTNQLFVGDTLPSSFSVSEETEVLYFVFLHDPMLGDQITLDNIEKRALFGSVTGPGLEGLLRLMTNVYVKVVQANRTWPETIKKEFSGQLNRFMASLTETTYQNLGATVLYIPTEDLVDDEECARQKDLVQRLESTLIHWTRQIKEVINSQDSLGRDAEDAGPLAEIEFWKSRTVDLSGIHEQLKQQGMLRILHILDIAKSSYLQPFQKLSADISGGSTEAQDNLRFLSTIRSPCEKLAKATPIEIPAILPGLLNCIRLIWNISSHYNTSERLTGLLRKISNEIIHRCQAQISLHDIFEGDVEAATERLQESINCGVAWKDIYRKCVKRMEKAGGRPWDFDENSIFAQVDAFVQRCRDLQEVCEGQAQFARKVKGGQAPMPIFGGSKGPEIAKTIVEIEATFEKHLSTLKNLDYPILDAKSTHWHDDYNSFKNGMKDLEVMFQNVINSAFETMTSVEQGISLMEAFYSLSKRENVRRVVEMKAQDVFNLFNSQLNTLKKEFDQQRKGPPLHTLHPTQAGSAMWARQLSDRIKQQWHMIEDAPYLPHNNESQQIYESTSLALNDYISKIYSDWIMSVSSSMSQKMNNTLLIKDIDEARKVFDKSERGLLEHNFDKDLLRTFSEIHYWSQMRYEVPYAAQELQQGAEKSRVHIENVLLIVRDYNRIISMMDARERRLLHERLAALDRKINPGIHKLTYAAKEAITIFVRDCRKFCREIYSMVEEFQRNDATVHRTCKAIADMPLIKIERKKVYEKDEFTKLQEEHRQNVEVTLINYFTNMKDLLQRNHSFIRNDSEEIQKQWRAYLVKIDGMLSDALRTAVKKSLQELARMMGEVRGSEVQINPLFKVHLLLQRSVVQFSPLLKTLAEVIEEITRELVRSIQILPKITEAISYENENDNSSPVYGEKEELPEEQRTKSNQERHAKLGHLPNFFTQIAEDDEILKIVSNIRNCSRTANDKLEKYITQWDKYKHIWDLEKADTFIRRYAKTKRELSAFESDINRYHDIKNQIQNEETITNISFVRLDCGILKSALVSNCNGWQNKFTELLNNIAFTELKTLHDLFANNTKKLLQKPSNLDQLGQSLDLLRKLQEDKDNIAARFEPVRTQYTMLEKFDVSVKPEETDLLDKLDNKWEAFQATMSEAQHMLESCKTNFKINLERSLENFIRSSEEMRDEFLAKGPFDDAVGLEKAEEIIEEFKEKMSSHIKKEEQLQQGLDIFNIPPPGYKEARQTQKEIDLLEQIWGAQREWDEFWNSCKYGKFGDLNVESMEEVAQRFHKKLHKLGREIKDWKVWQSMRANIDQFRKTMPLITDLKNPALRERHWSQLMEEIGKTFDPHGDEFTLEKVISLGLDSYEEVIGTISNAANKELSIEQAIQGIKETWAEVELEAMPYKDAGHHKLKATEDLFQALEDNQVTLSTMKASRFYIAFEEQVTYWEKALSHISESIEIQLQVQRQWMYLENIFVGSEDIRKQLPRESTLFDDVNANWKFVMDRIIETPNALAATHQEGFLELLNEMNLKLEKIQKSLDQYLETKRQAFPRFYFLSNEDLLEILGQARDPNAVQPHLKKCFEAIKSLDFQKAPGSKRFLEAHAIISPEGEVVPVDKVSTDGAVEVWLLRVENAMKSTLRRLLSQCFTALRQSKREKWIKDWQGQLLITAGQIQWTNDCTKALGEVEKGSKTAMRQLKKKQFVYLNKLSDMVRGQLTPIDRLKLNALITIEVHARDVIERMGKEGASSVTDFLWLQQLRFYWDLNTDSCIVRQTNTSLDYGYEYLGNNGRLVITPLTDRCYMTLTTALQLRRGGNPLGPAGTGKTETVKDLGKAIAKYVIVFNCSDGLDYKSMGRMFSGLAQTGAWSCFDEFNRIDVEVLSVVAQQILSILSAIGEGVDSMVFEGTRIKLDRSCGIFVTMNPGYAGRSELPDNLKALLRPIAMMVPDSALIAEIMLFSEGFTTSKNLSKKLVTLYQLSIQQLSKQDHYDFGLRNIKTVLICAGSLKRADPDMNEEVILYRALRDMNMPKFLSDDAKLFAALMTDLFPTVEPPSVDYGSLLEAIQAELRENKDFPLQLHPTIIKKIIQVYEAKSTRHGNMLVGRTGAGKSTAWNILCRALTRLSTQKNSQYQPLRAYVINPKSVSLGELYGEYDLNTNEWTDGILSSVMRTVCADEKPDEKWIVFDGPVDTLWIESMNTVLDDNKMLTLISGERISMPKQVGLLFEVQDLSVASPATVSRAGMVYLDVADFGWDSYMQSWLEKRDDPATAEVLKRMFETHFNRLWDFKRHNCKEIVPIVPINACQSLCHLFDCLATKENGVDPSDTDGFTSIVEMWFLFCLVWSVGGAVDIPSRKKLDMCIREIVTQFPSKDTVYEYFVDPKSKQWKHWEEQINTSWKPPADTPFYKILVPTVDTVRNSFLCSKLIAHKRMVLLAGDPGTGKTFVLQQVLSRMGDSFMPVQVNFSSATSSDGLQKSLESRVEKKTKDVFGPPGGKKMIVFLDDLNMPAKDTFGSQPPIELLRHWIDYGFWYDRQKQTKKSLRDMQLVGAMGPPGGGRNVITERFQSRFHVLNFTFPSEQSIQRIFGTLLNSKLIDFEEEVKPLSDPVTKATLELFNQITENLLPTPTKSHYLFSLRDLGKVFQGLLQAHPSFVDSKEGLLRLWVHELFRIFYDRLIDQTDRKWLLNLVQDKLNSEFDLSWKNLYGDGDMMPFGNFLRDMEDPPYEELTDATQLKQFMEEKLEDYNAEPGTIPMDLVLFMDAIHHVCRIIRILKQARGNALLVGVGGSGRQSLTRLASYICEYKVFTIEITKNYRSNEFREDLKKLYTTAGGDNVPVTFLFNDTQVVVESFLEDINNILGSGEVPNLFGNDELPPIYDAVRKDAKAAGVVETNDNLYAFFIERVRNNLHVVLAMSPVGEAFRNRIRMYPSLVSCTTVDWFLEWPEQALQEVAAKFLDDVDLGTPEMKLNVSQVFAVAHSSVIEQSRHMLLELKRNNYVTPTNYLELVKGYRKLLADKRKVLGEAAFKLQNGLDKLEDAKKQVEEMSVELEEKKVIVAKSQKECEELLVVIVQERRVVDEQQKLVTAESEKIAKEEAEALTISADAQADLDQAMPALEAAQKALDALTKKDVSEVKAYAKPPPLVELVMCAVMVLLKTEPTWTEAKKQLGDANFLSHLVHYNKDNISDSILSKIGKYTKNPEFQPDVIRKVSNAASGLCMWVRAMEVYGRIAKDVAPKRARLKNAMDTLNQKKQQMQAAKDKLEEVQSKVQQLKDKYDASVNTKETLRKESEELETKLARAEKLVDGLSGERTRWEAQIENYNKDIGFLVGDCLIAAAFLSYCGPFTSEYRHKLVDGTWMPEVKRLEIPFTSNFSFSTFLADPTDVRDWNIQGLPADDFSTENGVLVTKGERWPLLVDPQGQGCKWVKNMEKKANLKVIDLGMSDYLRTVENAVQFGTPVLLQDVYEELDPALEPVLTKAITKQGSRMLMKIGDKEVEYNIDFRMYITTKLNNPHYPPEISTKTTIVNCAVKEQGLRAQLLGIVVREERPDLEEQKNELVVKVAAGKRKLVELEDTILRLLSTAQGSLLDDEELVNTLNNSKTTAEEVKQQLVVAEQTEVKIDKAREGYAPSSFRSALLYFVLNDMSNVDPMYQWSLESYIELFKLSISKSSKSDDLKTRIDNLNDYHTHAVYRNTCRGLFEKHKLLFSFLICTRILKGNKKLNEDEFNFYLRGGLVLDRDSQPPNPDRSWILEQTWDHITELDKLATFRNLVSHFESNVGEWAEWYRNEEPEQASLPGEWHQKCDDFQKLIVLRVLRPDRVGFAATSFISQNLGPKFVEPPILDLNAVYQDSQPAAPLIFVLSPGVDPTTNLIQLAEAKEMSDTFKSISLGQGQAPIATKMIDDGIQHGHWVFLANCHLSISWMPALEKIIEGLKARNPHENFRLWLSSNPHPKFPISILQNGLKMTTEPPKGLKANLMRLYSLMPEKQFYKSQKPEKYKKLLYSLCYFHAVLLERRKFRNLGFNIPYDFNDSDFNVSENILQLYLDEYEQTPWSALRYLVAEASYGGRVTDDWDRRLINVYISQFFCDDALAVPNFRLSSMQTYFIPDDGNLNHYKDSINVLPNHDNPLAFGQHNNADVASQIEDTTSMLATLVSLQPAVQSASGESPEEKVLSLINDLQEVVPEDLNVEEMVKNKADDPSPLHVVLFQESERYNILLKGMRSSLTLLAKGIQGLVVISSELEDVFQCLLDNRVPPGWLKAYPSLKPLASWIRDLVERINQLREWAENTYPTVYWLGGFTFPTGFLTAVLQASARKNNIAIDTLSWEFPIINADEKDLTQSPKEGVYIKGLYVEGASWDYESACLCEPRPMELVCPMPIIHFKPVESKKKAAKGTYQCPCYLYPTRTGTRERPSYMLTVDLKSGEVDGEYWTKRGTALLLALAY